MQSNDSLRSSITPLVEAFTAELEAIVRQSTLNQVMNALGGSLGTRASGRGRRKAGRGAPRKAASSGKRSSEKVEAMGEKLLAYVTKHPGQRGDQIAKAVRSDVKSIRLPMKKLIAAKQVKTKGQRRGMTYAAA